MWFYFFVRISRVDKPEIDMDACRQLSISGLGTSNANEKTKSSSRLMSKERGYESGCLPDRLPQERG